MESIRRKKPLGAASKLPFSQVACAFESPCFDFKKHSPGTLKYQRRGEYPSGAEQPQTTVRTERHSDRSFPESMSLLKARILGQYIILVHAQKWF